MAKKSLDQSDLIADFDIGVDTGEISRKTMVRMDRPVKMIHVDSIIQNSPTQTRVENFNPDKVKKDEELLLAVKEHGVLQPVMVKKIATPFGQEAQYVQVFGHRRVAAARAAEVEYVPAIIANSDEDVAVLTIVENVGTRELSGFERAMALKAMLTENPDMKPFALVKATGIPQSTVYNLLAALDKSPKALVDLFMSGLGMRSVTTLQPVFASIPQEKHDELAMLLDDVTSRQAEGLADAVAQGIDPFVALNSIVSVGVPKGTDADPLLQEELEDAYEHIYEVEEDDFSESEDEELDDHPVNESNQVGPVPVVESIDDPDQENEIDLPGGEIAINAIASLCGVKESDVTDLSQSPEGKGASAEELTVASWYLGHGGNKKNAVCLAKKALTAKTVGSLVRRHKAAVSRAKALIVKAENEDDSEMADFLRVFFSVG